LTPFVELAPSSVFIFLSFINIVDSKSEKQSRTIYPSTYTTTIPTHRYPRH